MGKPFAVRFNYKIDATHELFSEVRYYIIMRHKTFSIFISANMKRLTNMVSFIYLAAAIHLLIMPPLYKTDTIPTACAYTHGCNTYRY